MREISTKKMHNMHTNSSMHAIIVIPIIFSLFFPFMVLQASGGNNGKRVSLDDISVVSGATQYLGGGDYFAVAYGDNLFGVVYGNYSCPNGVSVFSISSRIIGVADVYGEKGAKIASEMPVEIESIAALKMLYILEWNDSNDNGVCNFRRTYDGLNGYSIVGYEKIYKGVDLAGDWNISKVNESSNANERIWQFYIYRDYLPYRAINGSLPAGTLERVRFDFTIRVTLNDIKGKEYPSYKVVVSKRLGQYGLQSVNRTGSANFSGTELDFSSKIDNTFEGWDIDSSNAHPRLLLESAWVFGNRAERNVALWAKSEMLSQQSNGTTSIASENAEYNISRDSSEYGSEPFKLRPRPISVADSWQRIGYLRWVSGVNITRSGSASEGEAYMQVQAWTPLGISSGQAIFDGIALYCGFSYPAGEKVVHDPELGGSILVLSQNTNAPGQKCGMMIAFIAIGTTAIASSAAGLAYVKRKRDQTFYDKCIRFEQPAKKRKDEMWQYVGK